MAISVDWETRIISIPRADMLLLQSSPSEIRQLDTDAFRLGLRDLEDQIPGILYPPTHSHNTTVTVGGVTLARVIEIINGYTITFEDGQYRVILAGSNNNILDVANVNQVSIAPTNSAGLTYSKQVEDSAFLDGRIWIDTVNGSDSSVYPSGTYSFPCKTLENVQGIVSSRSLSKRIHLVGELTVPGTADISGYNVLGESIVLSKLDVIPHAVTNNLVIQDCEITGDLNGNITARRATSFLNLQDFDGTLHGTGLGGTITLQLGTTAHEFIDCYSQEGGVAAPIVDCRSMVNPEIYFRRYSGGIEIRNFTSGDMTIGGSDLRVILHSSCTGGNIKLYGTMELEDNSSGSNVIKSGIMQELVYSYILEGGLSLAKLLRLVGAALLGNVTGTESNQSFKAATDSARERFTSNGSNGTRSVSIVDDAE